MPWPGAGAGAFVRRSYRRPGGGRGVARAAAALRGCQWPTGTQDHRRRYSAGGLLGSDHRYWTVTAGGPAVPDRWMSRDSKSADHSRPGPGPTGLPGREARWSVLTDKPGFGAHAARSDAGRDCRLRRCPRGFSTASARRRRRRHDSATSLEVSGNPGRNKSATTVTGAVAVCGAR